jgi:hypothetical protein
MYPLANIHELFLTGHRSGGVAVVVPDELKVQFGKVVQLFACVQMMVKEPPESTYPFAH